MRSIPSCVNTGRTSKRAKSDKIASTLDEGACAWNTVASVVRRTSILAFRNSSSSFHRSSGSFALAKQTLCAVKLARPALSARICKISGFNQHINSRGFARFFDGKDSEAVQKFDFLDSWDGGGFRRRCLGLRQCFGDLSEEANAKQPCHHKALNAAICTVHENHSSWHAMMTTCGLETYSRE